MTPITRALLGAFALVTLPITAQALEFTGADLSWSSVYTPEDDDADTYDGLNIAVSFAEGPVALQFDFASGSYDRDTLVQSVTGHIGYALSEHLTLGGYATYELWGSDDEFTDYGLELAYARDALSLEAFVAKRTFLDTPLDGQQFALIANYDITPRINIFGSYYRDHINLIDRTFTTLSAGVGYDLTDAFNVALTMSEYYTDGEHAADETQFGLLFSYELKHGATFGPRSYQSFDRD